MDFREFPTHRIFSENGLWQRYEKPGLARHAGVINRIRLAPLSFLGLPAVVSFGNAQIASVAKPEVL
jgi:hypothetical protein